MGPASERRVIQASTLLAAILAVIPMFEVCTVLFVRADSPITFAKDDEIVGKSLCLPVGQSTHELDKGGRNWVKENKITLLRPQNVEECFRLLGSGSVNAVVTPDLTGKFTRETRKNPRERYF